MIKLSINQNNYITLRDTPWDQRVFGFKTNEFLEIKYETDDALIALIENHLDKYNTENKILLSYGRINANDFTIKKILQENNFYYAESAIELICNTSSKPTQCCDTENMELICELNNSDKEELRRICAEAFNYSRFHEDKNITGEMAKKRYYYWIDDLTTQNKLIAMHKINGKIISFMFYEIINKNTAKLILGGSDKGYGAYTYYFYNAVINKLKSEGFKRIYGFVSTANITTLNIHFALGFTAKNSYVDFHKFYSY